MPERAAPLCTLPSQLRRAPGQNTRCTQMRSRPTGLGCRAPLSSAPPWLHNRDGRRGTAGPPGRQSWRRVPSRGAGKSSRRRAGRSPAGRRQSCRVLEGGGEQQGDSEGRAGEECEVLNVQARGKALAADERDSCLAKGEAVVQWDTLPLVKHRGVVVARAVRLCRAEFSTFVALRHEAQLGLGANDRKAQQLLPATAEFSSRAFTTACPCHRQENQE